MNRKSLQAGILALTIIVALTSCNRQNTPEFASGRFKHKEKMNKQADESVLALQQREKIEPIATDKTQALTQNTNPGEDKPLSIKRLNVAPQVTAKAVTHNKKPGKAITSLSNSEPETTFEINKISNEAGLVSNDKARQSGGSDDDKILLVILAILLPPLAVYLLNNDITTDFWIDLILTLIFWIPGVIYALYLILR